MASSDTVIDKKVTCVLLCTSKFGRDGVGSSVGIVSLQLIRTKSLSFDRKGFSHSQITVVPVHIPPKKKKKKEGKQKLS
jgi:hypothetical protein